MNLRTKIKLRMVILREQHNWSGSTAASRAGMSRVAWDNAVRRASVDNTPAALDRLAAGLGMDRYRLVHGTMHDVIDAPVPEEWSK